MLSARSTKTPSRENQKDGSRSMVRIIDPSNSSEVCFTKSRKRGTSSRQSEPFLWASSNFFSSSQAPLMASHISAVSAVRTARPLVRADSMQLRMEDGFEASKARKSITESASAVSCLKW